MVEFQRRAFLAAIGAILAASLPSSAQDPSKVRRIGVLALWPKNDRFQEWLTKELAAVGYEEKRNLLIEWRWGNARVNNLPALVSELINHKVELIIAVLNDEIEAAKKATATIPIVMLFGCLPVELGYISNLRRPGGNVTGTTYLESESATKALQLLMEAKPSIRRIAFLVNPLFPGMRIYWAEVERAALSFGVRLERFEATRTEQVPLALERIASNRPDAFWFLEDPVISSLQRNAATFALEHKLISIGMVNSWALLGGLLSYYADADEIVRHSATYVDRILRGAKPADLPVEQPTRYKLAVNLKTAKTIGFAIPQSLLLQADTVIQ